MLNAKMPSLKDKIIAEEEARQRALEKMEEDTKKVEVKVKKAKDRIKN